MTATKKKFITLTFFLVGIIFSSNDLFARGPMTFEMMSENAQAQNLQPANMSIIEQDFVTVELSAILSGDMQADIITVIPVEVMFEDTHLAHDKELEDKEQKLHPKKDLKSKEENAHYISKRYM